MAFPLKSSFWRSGSTWVSAKSWALTNSGACRQ